MSPKALAGDVWN